MSTEVYSRKAYAYIYSLSTQVYSLYKEIYSRFYAESKPSYEKREYAFLLKDRVYCVYLFIQRVYLSTLA